MQIIPYVAYVHMAEAAAVHFAQQGTFVRAFTIT